jgi:hypothetical protein
MGGFVDPERLREAYELSAAAGPARARYEFDTGWEPGQAGRVADSMPGWLRVATYPFRALLRRAFRDVDMGHQVQEGVVDLAGRCSWMAVEHGPRTVVVGSRMWFGEPHDTKARKRSLSAGTTHPLWLLELLKGAVRAEARSVSGAGGETGESYAVLADLSRASAATPGGLAPCTSTRVEDLAALELTVDLDDSGRVRGVAGSPDFGETGNHSYRVELWDFGAVRSPVPVE